MSSNTRTTTTPHKISIPFVSQKAEDLFLWRNPKKSGIIFGGATVIFIAFMVMKTPFISIICYTAATAILLATLWARFGKSVGRPMPELPAALREGLSETDYKSYADKLKPHVDKALGIASSLVTCRDFALNLKITAALFVAGFLLACLSPITIAYLVVLVAFTAPRIYEEYKEHIDKGIVQAREQATKQYNAASSEVNRFVEKSPALQKVRGQFSAATKKAE